MNKEQLIAWYQEFKKLLTDAGVDLNNPADLMRLRVNMPSEYTDLDDSVTEGYLFIPKGSDGSYAQDPPEWDDLAEARLADKMAGSGDLDAEYEIYEISKSRLARTNWEYCNQRLFDETDDKDLKQIEHIYHMAENGQILLQDRQADYENYQQIYISEDDTIKFGPKSSELTRIFGSYGDMHPTTAVVEARIKEKGLVIPTDSASKASSMRADTREELEFEYLRNNFGFTPKNDIKTVYRNCEKMNGAVIGQVGFDHLEVGRVQHFRNNVMKARFEHPEYFYLDGTFTDDGFAYLMPVYNKSGVANTLNRKGIDNVFKDLYKTLDDADPALMHSHQEFKDLKAAVKDLADNAGHLTRDEVDAKISRTIELSNRYLRSKQVPGVDISKRTIKRISAVSEIRNTLGAAKELRLENKRAFEKRVKADAAGQKEIFDATTASITEKISKAEQNYAKLILDIRNGDISPERNATEEVKQSLAELMTYKTLQKSYPAAKTQQEREQIERIAGGKEAIKQFAESKQFAEFFSGLKVRELIDISQNFNLLDPKMEELNKTPNASKHNDKLVSSVISFNECRRYTASDEFFYESEKAGADQLREKATFGVTTSRTGRNAIAIAKLINDGYKIEDILDPFKLYTEKQLAGTEVLDHLTDTPENLEWVSEQLFRGSKKLTDQMCEMIERSVEPGFAQTKDALIMNRCGAILQDLAQERDHKVISESIESRHKEEYEKDGIRTYLCSNIIKTYFAMNNTAASLVNNGLDGDIVIAEAVANTVFMQALTEAGKKPGGIMGNITEADLSAYGGMKGAQDLAANAGTYENALASKNLRVDIANDLLSGKFFKESIKEASVSTNEFGVQELKLSLKPCSYKAPELKQSDPVLA